MATSESQFSAGTACEPCQVLGHWCPAQDFNAQDDPACSPCLKGLPCSQQQVRKKAAEFGEAESTSKQPSATTARRQYLRHAVNKPSTPGVARSVSNGTVRVSAPFKLTADPGLVDVVPDEPTPVATQEMRDAVKTLDEPAQETLQNADCVKQNPQNFNQPLAGRTIRVVPLASLPPQLNWKSKHKQDVATFAALTPGNAMEISCTDSADAKRYAEVFRRALQKRKLRAHYRIHNGSCFFWKRDPPTNPYSEVSSR